MFEDGVVVVGTDTGVGKTVVAAGLLCALRGRGLPALPMKPVQTGASENGRAPDLDFCLASAGIEAAPALYDRLAPYRFPLPASPHLAARDIGVEIDPSRMLAAYRGLRAEGCPLVVEAAGGLLVPLTDSVLQIDVLVAMNLPFALVARAALGTLNHTLLSVAALRARGVGIARIYVNPLTADWDRIAEDNVRTLARWLPEIPVRRLERLPEATPRAAARLFSAGGV